MNIYEQSKKADEVVANAICAITKLCDCGLTTEESMSIMCMIEQLQNINGRIRREMKFEYESIL